MDNYVGKRLDGRYEVQEIIGVGGMSVVYKAYDNVDDRIVAVKILKDEFLQNDDFVRRFKNESKAIAVMSHPNIVKVYDVSFGEKLPVHCDGVCGRHYLKGIYYKSRGPSPGMTPCTLLRRFCVRCSTPTTRALCTGTLSLKILCCWLTVILR